MNGRPPVVYESAQTRKFQLGRTEVIRSTSNEAVEWVASMDDVKASDKQRAELFRRAVARHLQYAAWAADGQGVDRHLFGLKKLLKEGEPLPGIYKDKAFAKTSHWELSTSQLSSPWFDGWGYGEGALSAHIPHSHFLLCRVSGESLMNLLLRILQLSQTDTASRTESARTTFVGRSRA